MTSVWAFIEYVESARSPGHTTDWKSSEFISLVDFPRLLGCKDYGFFEAIAGVRTKREFAPLYPPRGCPCDLGVGLSRHLSRYFALEEITGWLLLSEIYRALDYAGRQVNELSFEIRMVLEMMAFLVSNLGEGNVRLVFVLE